MRVRSPEASAALAHAAERIGLPVAQLPGDPAEVTGLRSADGVAWRAAGGYLTTLIAAGADIRLYGASPQWFANLPRDVTGRDVRLVSVGEAPDLVGSRPAVAKLADEKHPAFSAAWVRNADDLRNRLRTARLPADSTLIIMDHWLDLASEYRVFTLGRQPVGWSPYLVEGEEWSPSLRTHRASWHDEAAAFVAMMLAELPDDDVPPTAVIDVGRTDDGRFAVLEVNNVWSSGLYSCDPDGVLRAVLSANDPDCAARWRWQPVPVLGSF
ncbi:ATP-grasp domain-containing protein [Dactylosporangium sp. AC04546]|uniref:ATP-grasp domain-containing protein n=1 Tax=Dactylosporangium sp. AC04546 TaxID=2862460 RepID=UPI001EE05AA5|nr:ATP-grasp domain-containing protein [Dactylosporangium sp. AC04546]WVK87825.1 ATP-grasp domain-containing protein [Dactylosporangium sp. AC04546]